MDSKITIDNIQKWQNVKDGKPFEVIYLNTKSGSSYCAYPNTPGINLVGVGKTVVVHYKTNNWQGKEYRNVTRIMPAETVSTVPAVSTASVPSASPAQPAQQMISLLTDIKCLMETMLQNQSNMIATLATIKALTDHQEPHEPHDTHDIQESAEPQFDIIPDADPNGSDCLPF